ncbi:hypothetical protein E2L06_08220 [Haloterrigena sp. H1]|uniref:DUF7553 family protein n=1 Tax=Haloterrigena sp. H1 TaxID=2552943 RepID=UPI00110EB0C2|nr:hypothetical protein [Haloterrigena sp. H1]TMT86590.1 hypothetical protein E2L06_08220 [Haloterrigena sp. H1]
MNKHFHDSLYYLRRAITHARLGASEYRARLTNWGRARVGREPDHDPSRVDRVREDVRALEHRAETRARKTVKGARDRVRR